MSLVMTDSAEKKKILENPQARRLLEEATKEARIGEKYGRIFRGEEQITPEWARQIASDANSMRLVAIGEVIEDIGLRRHDLPKEIQNMFGQVIDTLPNFRNSVFHDLAFGQEIRGKRIESQLATLSEILDKVPDEIKKTTKIESDEVNANKKRLLELRAEDSQISRSINAYSNDSQEKAKLISRKAEIRNETLDLKKQSSTSENRIKNLSEYKNYIETLTKYVHGLEIISPEDLSDPKKLKEALKDAANLRDGSLAYKSSGSFRYSIFT